VRPSEQPDHGERSARGARGSRRGFELQCPSAMPHRQGTLRAEEGWLVASIASEMLSCRRGDDGGRYDKKQEGLVSIMVGNNDYAWLGGNRALPILLAPCDARGSLLGCLRDVSILALASLVMRCRRVGLARGDLTSIESAWREKPVTGVCVRIPIPRLTGCRIHLLPHTAARGQIVRPK
jgi:hypothetical protein